VPCCDSTRSCYKGLCVTPKRSCITGLTLGVSSTTEKSPVGVACAGIHLQLLGSTAVSQAGGTYCIDNLPAGESGTLTILAGTSTASYPDEPTPADWGSCATPQLCMSAGPRGPFDDDMCAAPDGGTDAAAGDAGTDSGTCTPPSDIASGCCDGPTWVNFGDLCSGTNRVCASPAGGDCVPCIPNGAACKTAGSTCCTFGDLCGGGPMPYGSCGN